ncbi:hypothetical protein V6N12_051649 [Hibiscus sabdariffa]|uniref:Uncharacterized protein n=1 Tax=Hibiscus sabdariffa TaxID=183260 RepID=A0ABR2GG72_9ROSI
MVHTRLNLYRTRQLLHGRVPLRRGSIRNGAKALECDGSWSRSSFEFIWQLGGWLVGSWNRNMLMLF